ncbi:MULTISPECIES: hypothetical protein [Enterobacterales]|uniref:DUF3742 domain-containing protein n=1 Tax=Erwinia billingiae (strain Eb661) TaxID=634500 RepID=D8MJD6_ERWBE|nr:MULTISPECIES: hypothetical protein [Enterobacterales]MCE9900822.1 DUF3742 family protein [Raoultella terrigena]CAX53320.1 uncharacterized protein EbC_pEb10200420 [Erwinia billingiae Eb661]
MQNSAYKRGAIAAELWLKLTRSARVANEVCVSWVLRQGLPGFIGYLPVPLASIAILSIAILCGLFIGTVVILCGIFIYMLCNIAVGGVEDSDDTDEPSGHQYRDGNDGFGMYSGPQNVTVTSSRIDRDDEED